jgi:hypothetical protein
VNTINLQTIIYKQVGHREGPAMKLLVALCIDCLAFVGCGVQPEGQEKLATIHCQEVGLKDSQIETYASFQRWEPGEYRFCYSLNIADGPRGSELDCDTAPPFGDLSHAYDHGKTFVVRFLGGLAYDKQKGEGATNYWRCQRVNDTGVRFVCTAITPPQ